MTGAARRNPALFWSALAIAATALVVLPFALSGIGTTWVRVTNLALLFGAEIDSELDTSLLTLLGRLSARELNQERAEELES